MRGLALQALQACCRPWGCKESDTTGRLNNNNNIYSHKSGRILANILTLVIVEKILVNFNFTFLGIHIVFYFLPKKKERKEAEDVRLNIILGSTQFILQALESH